MQCNVSSLFPCVKTFCVLFVVILNRVVFSQCVSVHGSHNNAFESVFLQDRRMSTDAGSRITAKVAPSVSTIFVSVRQVTTFHAATANAFAEKVHNSIILAHCHCDI